jgi:hypothetical protein
VESKFYFATSSSLIDKYLILKTRHYACEAICDSVILEEEIFDEASDKEESDEGTLNEAKYVGTENIYDTGSHGQYHLLATSLN